MRTRITIDWNSETREALVQINDRQPRTWTDCDLSILKQLEDQIVDGFEVRADTDRRRLVLEGLTL